jgi:hypothetical protein
LNIIIIRNWASLSPRFQTSQSLTKNCCTSKIFFLNYRFLNFSMPSKPKTQTAPPLNVLVNFLLPLQKTWDNHLIRRKGLSWLKILEISAHDGLAWLLWAYGDIKHHG